MSKIAFLGLGAMGTPMARRLLAAGHDVTVWNRTAARAEALRADGARIAGTPSEAVADAEYVVTMLADPAAVEAVVGAFADALRADAVVIEMSTIGPDAVHRVRALVPDSVRVIDAPAMGSIDRAASGELIILAGGDVEAGAEVLATLGTVTHCGALGSGSARKMVLINGIIAGVALVGETLALADRLGVENAQEVLAASMLGPLVGRAFATGADFSLEMAAKDLGLAADVVELPLLEAARATLLSAPDQNADLGAVVAHIRDGAAK